MAQIRYSIPEELKIGSLVGNIAQDLGLDLNRLRSGRARIVTGENIQHTELKADKGTLIVNERIDREQLCGEATPCSFTFEILLENPMELHPVTIEVLDVNDNAPTFQNNHLEFEISESAALGSRFGLESADDNDVGQNGLQNYILTPNDNFVLKQHVNPDGSKYAEMVLQKALDREEKPHLSLKLLAVDGGNPQKSVKENNFPGVSILTLTAKDLDDNQNARVSYILEERDIGGAPISEYISVNSESGVVLAVRSFDYEQLKEFVFVTRAQDGGSPPLSSNVTVKILIQDQNDNPPQVLYPVQTGGSMVAEMVPRSADVGYLVTKVVAVDVDSGQNAWLSYKLQKATDRALFEVGLQNGEIRTIRQVTDKDAVKQRLTVIVEDNGQPSRSATVIVNVAVADSFPEVLSEFTDFPHDKEYNDNLTFYLVLALAVVSFLFITCLVVIISVKIYRWRQSRLLYHSSLPVIPYYPPRYSDTLGTGTLPHVYNYEVCRTTDSRKSDNKFGGAGSQNVLIMDPSSTGTMQRIQSEKSILDEPDSPVERRRFFLLCCDFNRLVLTD
ncbi:hypothetical protein CRENBAI_021523 [Crenichthys baileyi]|uniref:Cadherin domain-containing protein n=1 Tax=Crenichthys baileyi TaxID=28760 RepID=A0AAV9R3J3_9TELE